MEKGVKKWEKKCKRLHFRERESHVLLVVGPPLPSPASKENYKIGIWTALSDMGSGGAVCFEIKRIY